MNGVLEGEVEVTPVGGDLCLIEHRGVCVSPGTVFGDSPTVMVPPEIEGALRERLGAR